MVTEPMLSGNMQLQQMSVTGFMNRPWQVGPAEVFQQVADRATVARAELVGLVPRSLVEALDPNSWDRLNLSLDQTIEQRLEQQQLPVD